MAEANHTSRVPEYDNDGDAHRLTCTTHSVVEPQTTLEAPHDAPTPATNDVIHSASISHPSAKITMPAEPPPSCIKSNPDGTISNITTTSGITGPAYDLVFIHHALVDSPRDPTTSVFATPTNMAHDSIHTAPAHTAPGDPVTVDPIRRACLNRGFWPILAMNFSFLLYHFHFRRSGIPRCDRDGRI